MYCIPFSIFKLLSWVYCENRKVNYLVGLLSKDEYLKTKKFKSLCMQQVNVTKYYVSYKNYHKFLLTPTKSLNVKDYNDRSVTDYRETVTKKQVMFTQLFY